MRLPTFECYCPNTTAANALVFDLGPISVWYSYKTPVAFQCEGRQRVVRENVWGPTSGRHINAIDDGDKDSRVSGVDFERMLIEALASCTLVS